jgi:hypothetical protein
VHRWVTFLVLAFQCTLWSTNHSVGVSRWTRYFQSPMWGEIGASWHVHAYSWCSPLKGDSTIYGPISGLHIDLTNLKMKQQHNSHQWQHQSFLSFFLSLNTYAYTRVQGLQFVTYLVIMVLISSQLRRVHSQCDLIFMTCFLWWQCTRACIPFESCVSCVVIVWDTRQTSISTSLIESSGSNHKRQPHLLFGCLYIADCLLLSNSWSSLAISSTATM